MKKIVIILSVTLIALVLICGLFIFNLEDKGNVANDVLNEIGEKRKVRICEFGYNEGTYNIDLNSDDVEEKVTLFKSGDSIEIDNKRYVVNKYYSENDHTENYYYITDLNNDGYAEIIYKTVSYMISPPTNSYIIYNFKNNMLSEIGSFGIIGNLPEEITVKGNKIEFEYWPYESPKDYTKKMEVILNVR